jgi:hypothetical protein
MYAPDAHLQMAPAALETMGRMATGNRRIMLIEGGRFRTAGHRNGIAFRKSQP